MYIFWARIWKVEQLESDEIKSTIDVSYMIVIIYLNASLVVES